jgi:hypothetical protein
LEGKFMLHSEKNKNKAAKINENISKIKSYFKI